MGAKPTTCTRNWEKTNQYLDGWDIGARVTSDYSSRKIRTHSSELLNRANLTKLDAIRNQRIIEYTDSDIAWDEILESSSGHSICSSVHILGEDFTGKRECQELKSTAEDIENMACNPFPWVKESALISSSLQSDPDQCTVMSSRAKTCQQSSVSRSEFNSKISKELGWYKDIKKKSDILQLPDLNMGGKRTSGTIPADDDIHQGLYEQDTSSPGGHSSCQENQTFSEAVLKDLANLIKNPGLYDFWEKYAEIFERSKTDAPLPFSTDNVDSKMWVLENHARAILAAVHHILKDRFTSSEHQNPAQLFKFTDCNKSSHDNEFWSAVDEKQLAALRVTCEEQKERITELETAVANHKIERKHLTEKCEDLDLRIKAYHDKTSQLLANCKAQTECAEKLQKDLDQCVAEVDRLETELETISSQKNKVWEELQVENQSSTEQKKMLSNVTRKYTEEVERLQQLLDSMNSDNCVKCMDSDLLYSVAFDDLPSERGQLFSKELNLSAEPVIPEAPQNTPTDDRWRTSQDNIAKVLQKMPSIFELDREIHNLKTSEQNTAVQNETNSLTNSTTERGDVHLLDHPLLMDSHVTSGDVSFTLPNGAGFSLQDSSQSEVTQKIDLNSQKFEHMEHCSFSARESKDHKPMFTRQLSAEDLSSLLFFDVETKESQSPKSTPIADMTDLKPLLEKSPWGSHGVTEDNLTSKDERPRFFTESDVTSRKQLDEFSGCAGELVSSVNLVEFVGELFNNVLTIEGFLSWDTFSVTLSKHCCCSNELLRPVFDACNINNEEMISFDDLKEKLKSDVSDPFVVFRNNIFSQRPLVLTKEADCKIFANNQVIIPSGTLGDTGCERKKIIH